jgi:ADP-heptose:LPS heptosyltransferase
LPAIRDWRGRDRVRDGEIDSGLESFDLGFRAGEGAWERIIVERYRGLGDVVQLMPSLAAMKEKYGRNVEIGLATSGAYFPIVGRFEFIDFVLEQEEVEEMGDWGEIAVRINLQGRVDFLPNCRKGARADLFSYFLRVDSAVNEGFRFPVLEEERVGAFRILERVGWTGGDLIGLNLVTNAPIRNWPVERSEELADRVVREMGMEVLILENQPIRERFLGKRGVIVPDRVGVSDLVGLISVCRGVVCPDSGVMHLSGMMGIPTVALFGPIPPELRIKYYPSVRSIYLGLECQPCYDWQTHACEGKPWYRQCMNRITVEMVLEEIEKF